MKENNNEESNITVEDLVISHSYEMLALITVLEKKGVLTREEIVEVIHSIRNQQAEPQSNQ